MNILHLDSSILGDASASRQLSRAVVTAVLANEPESNLRYRDLAADELDHLSGASLAAVGTPEELRDAAQRQAAALAEATLNEFLEADLLVIGAPMYNFSVPSQLKAWIDRIAVAGKTFRYGPNGAEGLAGGKRVILVSTAGGVHGNQPSGAAHEGYMKLVLGFLGITDIEIVRAHGLAMGDDVREAAMTAAQQTIEELYETA
ncbi:FMN-dependent NADH-azoreductase [Stutzerimonas stutzeri]|uniref:FMN dependent NADH:quinone oxidoreductase n=1 Tax=Stutzerimonas stutzeri TaxID=316 RepID=W8QZI5_STUST|nr:NAD(P)H-dependent oxidoreductase [Stutzerimonas stutzeri]AHL75749.1 FMN-dependent NADH-azoreductase [Stutzerimonas stutzeri]MCQ4331507.1 NAD(P)H-dependent oxidoreductase [Stutzerimonas stutzeri]